MQARPKEVIIQPADWEDQKIWTPLTQTIFDFFIFLLGSHKYKLSSVNFTQ